MTFSRSTLFNLSGVLKAPRKGLQIIMSLSLFLFLSTTALAQPVLEGYAALNEGNYQKAISIWTKAADEGDIDSMGALRSLYEEGSEGWDDVHRESGLFPAAKAATDKYFSGYDAYIAGDYALALRDFTQSANAGNNHAQGVLGHMYQYGLGTKQSHELALHWTQISANKGNIVATTRLGTYYYDGLLIERSYSRALALFRQAAEQGNVQALIQLGYMYADGHGVAQSNSRSLSYFREAKEKGSPEGAKIYIAFQEHIADYERRAAAVRESNREVDAYNRRVKANNDRIRRERASKASQYSDYLKAGQNYWANWKPSYCSRFISSSNTTTRGECAN